MGVWVPWAAARQVQDFAGRPLGPHLFLEQHDGLHHRLGPGRAAGDVDVHRHYLVHPLHHAVTVVHAAAVGAGTHGDHPFGLGHLLVEAQDHRGDLLEDRAGDDEQVRLPGGAPEDLGPEAGDIEAGRPGGDFFDETAGEPEEHRPEAVSPAPVDQAVQAADHQGAVRPGLGKAGFGQVVPDRGLIRRW